MVLTFILYSSSSSAMDWLHCNLCFQRDGRNLAVSSCGHISCEGCVNPEQCNICGAICSYLPISDKMKPQEKVYFKDPVKLLQSRLEHIAQIAAFQHRQKDRTLAYFKQKVLDLERRVKEIMEQSYRELSELRRENSELKKPLSQRRTPGSAFSLSSLSSLQDPRTPTGHLGTPHRQESATPSFFQFGSVLRLHSPTPWTQFAGNSAQSVTLSSPSDAAPSCEANQSRTCW
ncbi:hypothetical protein ANANG_G00168630 [Anguilla anguilla]|uniref:RING-type domain-containing protein n=1 Tax=Anguilla anguilla TaxID=7936 RepID=A0A9D3M4C1_ANGAN|nr:hypothetical protein ANANG_G00168630 [Anguilla anguilla]